MANHNEYFHSILANQTIHRIPITNVKTLVDVYQMY